VLLPLAGQEERGNVVVHCGTCSSEPTSTGVTCFIHLYEFSGILNNIYVLLLYDFQTVFWDIE